ncbi:MAG TPA: alcohol dehydrogenase catalytic domain-containing protein [Candidatus Dormibacteraeota bacterium]|nr:alcohol dehydrogenase catalytic domain-containing protein [Candidatus Dormibacteraeota bacterium]
MNLPETQVETERTVDTAQMMRAGVYRERGRVVVEQVPIPKIAPGEVLIRVGACGICGTDIKKIQHGFLKPPLILGHEVAGTVVDAGAGVTRWKPGDRVVSFHHIPCGHCFYCERRLFSQCSEYKKVGLTAGFEPSGGGFAEYVKAMPWIAERGMLAIPPGVTLEEATFIEPLNTCIKAVEKARVAEGELVAVLGQGPIGVLLTMLAHYRGAEVVTSDPLPSRRAASLRFGAEASFEPDSAGLAAEVRRRSAERGADAVLVAAAIPALVEQGLALARPGGRVLLFAHNDPVLRVELPAAAVGIEEKEILGSYSAAVDRQNESARLVFERVLPVREMISHRMPLEDIAGALDLATHPRADSMKVMVIP